jgi:hypothetical protein
MHFSTIITVVTAALSAIVFAGCFSEGEVAFQKTEAVTALRGICEQNFAGNFGKDESRHFCWGSSMENGRRWDFTGKRVGKRVDFLSYGMGDCEEA